MKKVLISIITAMGLVLSCEKAPEEVAVISVSIYQATVEMGIGTTIQLSASVQPSNATDKTLTWTSSNQSVATVSSSGLVTAIAEGNSTITAAAGGKSATCSVIVSKGTVEVSSIILDKEFMELVEGDTTTLTATVKPDDATDKAVTWSSSDATVASVDNGKIAAIKEGEATITAKAGDKTAECKVTVAKKIIAVTSIELNKTSLELVEGESETLIATVKPDDATDKSVTWSSSDASVASVDQNGKITTKAKGNAVIQVTANDGSGVFASCAVDVKHPCPAGAVDLGLSVYWATCNLSESGFVSSPEAYGDYYAWGETETKENYTWYTYKWCNGSETTLTKYNNRSKYGTVDNKTEFKDYDYEDDAARQALGGKWHIPNNTDWGELLDNCTWSWTTQNGVRGYRVTSKINGNSIFFPAAGSKNGTGLDSDDIFGDYWTSSLDTEYPYRACYLGLNSGGRSWNSTSRFMGLSVRPVSE